MADEALKELLDERYREIAELDEAIGEFNAGCPAQLRLIAKRDALKANADAAQSELARLRALRDHGKYLADAAEIYLNVMSDDDPEPDLSADSYGALRSCVYEFRKRFAQTSSFQLKSAPSETSERSPNR